MSLESLIFVLFQRYYRTRFVGIFPYFSNFKFWDFSDSSLSLSHATEHFEQYRGSHKLFTKLQKVVEKLQKVQKLQKFFKKIQPTGLKKGQIFIILEQFEILANLAKSAKILEKKIVPLRGCTTGKRLRSQIEQKKHFFWGGREFGHRCT